MTSRRQFLQAGGALVVAFSLAQRDWAQDAAKGGPELPGSLKKAPMRIHASSRGDFARLPGSAGFAPAPAPPSCASTRSNAKLTTSAPERAMKSRRFMKQPA